MSDMFMPLERLIIIVRRDPTYLPYVFLVAGGIVVLASILVFVFRKYFGFIAKSLLRNPVRSILSTLAVMVLVFVITLVWSVLLFLDVATADRARDFKAIVTERYRIPSQMPFAYARTLEEGAVRADRRDDIKPDDSMTWQFYGGTMDRQKMAFENIVFAIAMDPRKIKSMMDDMDKLDPALVEKMVQNKRGLLMGRTIINRIKKQVGDTLKLSGLNYKEIDLEFEIIGLLPEGRNDGTTIMHRSYLNDALDGYAVSHRGTKHPMAEKTLNLVWLRVPDSNAFQKVADQVMTSDQFTVPAVKCETASSGISSFLDAYRDLIWAAKWLLVPAILVTMALVIANAISISVRERRTEMAVLKVLGYSPLRIMTMVLGESVLVGAFAGLLSAGLTYLVITVIMGGFSFQIAFFPKFVVFADALWWGLVFGGLTSFVGSLLPAWSARRVRVSEVFAKIG